MIFISILFPIYSQSKDSDDLNQTLESVYDSDQSVRREFHLCVSGLGISSPECESYRLKMDSVDRINQNIVFPIIQDGWPLDEKISAKSNDAIFMVIQHASLDKQTKYLETVRVAHSRGKLPSAQYAIFDDRIRVGQGKKQKFGSQTGFDQYGNSYFFPIENFAGMDSLRAEMGLPEFKQYYTQFSGKGIYLDSATHHSDEKSILIIHTGDKQHRPVSGVQVILNDKVIGETNVKGFLYTSVPRKDNEHLSLVFQNSQGERIKYNLTGSRSFFDIYMVFSQK